VQVRRDGAREVPAGGGCAHQHDLGLVLLDEVDAARGVGVGAVVLEQLGVDDVGQIGTMLTGLGDDRVHVVPQHHGRQLAAQRVGEASAGAQ